MINFVKNYLAKRNAKGEYDQMLKNFLVDGVLSEAERKQLEDFAKRFGLTKEDLAIIQKRATSLMFENIGKDERITEQEKKDLESLMDYFDLNPTDFDFNQKNFNKFYTLALIDKGILPTPVIDDLNIILKKGEVLHWACRAEAKKLKKITQRVNYGGLTASIRITKGVRYRVGSVRLAPETKEIMVSEDLGSFWLTNQRIGFIGHKKNFSFSYDKILSFELYKDGISIHKQGRENPYMVGLTDIEVPAAILSFILNKGQYKIL